MGVWRGLVYICKERERLESLIVIIQYKLLEDDHICIHADGI
jgi:hypothetical protein